MVAVIEERAVRGLREVALLAFSACALFLLISLLTYSNEDAGWTHSGTGQAIVNSCGMVGAWISDFLLSLFGLLAYLFPVMIFWHGYMLFRQKNWRKIAGCWLCDGLVFFQLWLPELLSYICTCCEPELNCPVQVAVF